MRVSFEGRYTVEEFATLMTKVLRILAEGQFGHLEEIDLHLRAFDLDGRETYPSDERGRHAGLRFFRADEGQSTLINVDWHFPWLRGHEWPEDVS